MPLLTGPLARVGAASPTDAAAPASQAGGSGLIYLFVGVLIIVLLLALLARRRTARRPPTTEHTNPAQPYAAVPTARLETDADERLVSADDAVKTSEQELALATAEYGADATREFSRALDASRSDVTEAFRLKQGLDDEIPADEPMRRGWLVQIVRRCDQADVRLDANVLAFDRLRDVQARLATSIPPLGQQRDAIAARLPAVIEAYASMSKKYADSALTAVSDSLAQVTERLTFLDRTLQQARDALAGGHRPVAALAFRAAEEGVGQVEMLLDGIEKLSRELDAAMLSVQDMCRDVEADVAAGRAAVIAAATGPTGSTGPGTVELAGTVAAVDQEVTTARAELDGERPDPVRIIRRLEQANVRIDAALADVRDAATRGQRARTTLEQMIPSLRAEIEAVDTFITTRRGAVGSQARTRLVEAHRSLDLAMALAPGDPGGALVAGQRAAALADVAGQHAGEDVDGWTPPAAMDGSGGLGGAVLGGILVEAMPGGGGRPRRGMGGFSGRGFGWGGMIPGAYGGRDTRMRTRV